MGDGSKVWCCKEQYCIGTWNVRSKIQGKLKVVKQEMARVNIDILGISDLRWTGMGEFNSDDHYIYYCGQESLRRNGVTIIVYTRVQRQHLDAVSKTTDDRCSFLRQIIQYHGNPSLCQYCWSWIWMFLWRPARPSRINNQKICPFILGIWNAKVGS